MRSIKAESANRVQWVDSWRGIMILIVVFWHSLGALLSEGAGEKGNLSGLHEFIEHFHMIAFFAISGFVWNRGSDGFFLYLKKKFRRLMVPYYAFAFLSLGVLAVVDYVLGGSLGFSLAENLRAIAFVGEPRCYAPLWFLGCLFAVSLIYYWISRCTQHWIAALVVLLVIAYLEPFRVRMFCHVPFFSFVLVPRYLIAFMIGNLLARHLNKSFSVSAARRLVVFIPSCCILLVDVIRPLSGFSLLLGMALLIVATGGLSVAINNRYLAWIGRGSMTLGILCLHKFPIVFMQKLPVVKCCKGEMQTLVAVMGVTAFAVAFAVLGTLLLERHLPWILGKKVTSSQTNPCQ